MLHVTTDPLFLNQSAWAMRWRDRRASESYAAQALVDAGSTERGYREAGRALRTLAWQAKWRGDLTKSLDYCTRALGFLEKTGGWIEMADVYSILGVIHIGHMRMDLAEEAVGHGYACLEQQDCIDARVDLMTTEAFVHIHQNRVEPAFSVLDQAENLAEGMQVSRLPQNFARLLMYCGDHADAEAYSLRGIEICKKAGNRVVLPYMHEILGNALTARADWTVAKQVFHAGIDAAHADGDLRAKCQLFQRMGHLLLKTGAYEEACDALQYGARIAQVLGYHLVEARVQRELAEVHEAMGDTEAALAAMKAVDRIERARRT